MPFIVEKSDACPASKPYGVFTETSHGSGVSKGRPHGCFASQSAAREQQKALYASVPEAKAAGEAPPNLRDADEGSTERCDTCEMFFGYSDSAGVGFCSGYSNTQVRPDQVCDSYSPEPVETKSAGSPEVPMSATVSPVSARQTPTWRRDRALALSESQRKRTESRQVHEPLELREATEDGKRVLRSYASLFDSPYSVRTSGYRFTENICPGAFKRTLGTKPDVVFRTEHSGPPLAATWSGDLRLGEDERGLWYEVDLDESDPDVQALISKVNRGVYRESSFAFRVPKDGDRWNDEHDERDILACELDRGDVSVVTFGASRETGKHMVLRSEEALRALQEVGRQQFITAWKEYREWIVLPPEERVGKVISSQSAETLRRVLGLITDADDAVDEAEAMLSEFLGVPDSEDDEGDGEGGKVTGAEQLGALGRAEHRDDPDYEDYDVMYGLKNAKLALASVKACQLCDPGNGTDPDDGAVMAAIEAAEANVDQAIVAQAKDGRRDPEESNAEVKDIWDTCKRLAAECGWEVRELTNEDGSSGFSIRVRREESRVSGEGAADVDLYEDFEDEDRKALSSKARADLPSSAFVFPEGRRYPIHDISHARNALARASGKPEEETVKRAVYKRYPSLKPSASRADDVPAPPVVLSENDSEDLRLEFDSRVTLRRE